MLDWDTGTRVTYGRSVQFKAGDVPAVFGEVLFRVREDWRWLADGGFFWNWRGLSCFWH